MTPAEILEYPDDRLRKQSAPVRDFGAETEAIIELLFDTLYATSAIALSAPQINQHQEIFVVDLSEDRTAPQVFINPRIKAKSAWGFVQESCLSIPGVTGSVLRATQVEMDGQNRHGEPISRTLSGMEAVCLQHEMDHLVGRLFIDKMSPLRRWQIKAQANARRRSLQSA
ncbi:MAG: peptide deformylase [Pseudomonadota bacterium]